MSRFGGGATLAGLMLGAIAVFIIDRDFRGATVFALAAAVLSFFGLIHGAQVGFAVNLVSAMLLGQHAGRRHRPRSGR